MARPSSDLKSKRRKRLTIIFVTMLLVVGGIGGLAYSSYVQKQQRLQQRRDDGMAALAAHDPLVAKHNLNKYVNKESRDVEAMRALAEAWRGTPLPKRRGMNVRVNELQAADQLESAYRVDPANPELATELLELRHELVARQGQDKDQLLSFADQVLERHADLPAALRTKAALLASMDRMEEAVRVVDQRLAADPKDPKMRLLAGKLKRTLKQDTAPLVARLEDEVKAGSKDPVTLVELAIADTRPEAQGLFRQRFSAASMLPPADEEAAKAVLGMLDQVEMFPEALRFLLISVEATDSRDLREELARRAYEWGDLSRADEELAKLNATGFNAEFIALQSIALRRLGKIQEADALQQRLAKRQDELDGEPKDDPYAKAWSNVLIATQGMDGADNSKAVQDATEAAIEAIGPSPYLNVMLGRFYKRSGDLDKAAVQFRDAWIERPAWDMPRLELAKITLQQNRFKEAAALATDAIQRNPQSPENISVFLTARIAQLNPSDRAGFEQVMRYLDEVEKGFAGDQRFIPLRVEALAKNGQTRAAVGAAREALASKGELDQPLLYGLLTLNERYDLKIGDEIGEALRSRFGLSADLARSQALELHDAGQTAQGLSLIEKNTPANGDQRVRWRVARAQYLTSTSSPDAGEAWLKLAEEFPDQLVIQQLVVTQPVVLRDRELLGRAIARLEAVDRSQSLTWKLAKGRWLLLSGTRGDAAEAVDLLTTAVSEAPSQVDANLLLAQAHQRTGNSNQAITLLERAAALRPDMPTIHLDLARLYQGQQAFQKADARLNMVINSDAPDAQRVQAAILLARQGNTQTAIGVIEAIRRDGGGDDADTTLALASLYARTGRNADAERLVPALLKSGSPQAAQFVVSLYGGMDQPEKAARAVESVQGLDPPIRQTLLAQIAAGQGNRDAAVAAFQQAVQASPDAPVFYHQLIEYHSNLGEIDQIMAVAKQGVAKTGDPGMKALLDNADVVRQSLEQPFLRTLIVPLLTNDRFRGPALEAMQLVARARGEGKDLGWLSDNLRNLANSYPDFLGLQELSARLDVNLGRFAQAAATAEDAMNRFPNAAGPVELKAIAAAAQEDWDDALQATRLWLERSGADSVRPTLMLARVELGRKNPQGAMALLLPRVTQIQRAPTANVEATELLARAQVGVGNPRGAADMLRPLLTQDPAWRRLWMQLASEAIIDPREAASWLNEVHANVPANSAVEKTKLADAWRLLAIRTRQKDLMANTRRIIDEAVQTPDAPADAWMFRAHFAETQGDSATAMESYQKALELDPDQPESRNNLAMLLLNQPGGATQAYTLAKQAVQARPRDPNFQDTLAQAALAAGDKDKAEEAARTAVKLDPQNAAWQNRLADILDRVGKNDEAATVRKQLSADASNGG